MSRLTVAPEMVKAFPEAQVRLVIAWGLRNDAPWPEAERAHDDLAAGLANETRQTLADDDERIASWHDAYRQFGTNPRRFRPSLDALNRRLRKNGRLPRISGAVDAYNVVSVTSGTPAGAFDLSRLTSDVQIRFAVSGDWFTPLGEPEKVEEPRPGEVVYAQGNQVLTRHWNHRDADATKVTADTRDAVFLLERVSRQAVPDVDMASAQDALAALLTPHAEELTLAVLDEQSPEATLKG
ncbi:B3/B4 domain-containing protein [Streptomyces sp. DT193]|uniref:B3/B4 domain-containing protein n=1 Tax=Streptomyces sp. DT193 TaxID=3393418 RepID=UPI003CEFCE09